MKALHKLLVFTPALVVAGCNPVKSTAEAEKAATEFHTLFDAEDYEKIYDSAHSDFKGSQPKAETLNFIRSVREKLGAVKSTTRTAWQANSYNLKTNVVLTYSTEFQHGNGIETFTYRVSDGTATLLGWHINSKDLIVTQTKAEQVAP
ncbi:MAG TPA: DUF4019 domain-containing protein [Luteolibacter sp.]